MPIKLIAVGNRIMCDEGIAVRIAERLKDELLNEEVAVIFKETGEDISFEIIESSGMYIILDATCYGLMPGTITIIPVKNNNSILNNYLPNNEGLISNNNLITKAPGYIIGIEVQKITFKDSLSTQLEKEFITISEKVKSLIKILKIYGNISDLKINIVQNQINCLN